MVWPFSLKHTNNKAFKQKQRAERIAALKAYQAPLTGKEKSILDENVEDAVAEIKSGSLKPREVLMAYGKSALLSHERTNALTEIMLKDAEKWADEANLDGPLAGFPVSLKDQLYVRGYDATAGFSSMVEKTHVEDGIVARILRDAGAVPYVKTNVPATMMTIEGYNDLWGRTVNPHNKDYAPGGSSQGEAALIGSGGSRIGVGTDIGGSVRVPAAWSGIYSLRMTTFRFPMDGDVSYDMGFEGIPSVASPMAASIKDLRYFTDSVMSMKPWKYDYRLTRADWRKDEKVPAKPRIGVLRFEDFLPLTPAIERGLSQTTDALRKAGADVVEFVAPDPARAYDTTLWELYQADGYDSMATSKILHGEHNDPYVSAVALYTRIPTFLRRIFEFALRLFGFTETANWYANQRRMNVSEYYAAVMRREALRKRFRDAWHDTKLDFLITAVYPSPAVPNNTPHAFNAGLFTTLFNVLDYPAGVVPVGRVDKKKDVLPASFDMKKLSYQAKVTYKGYDAEKMEGLPIAVQVVALRHHDEEALSAMEYVVDALNKAGITYK